MREFFKDHCILKDYTVKVSNLLRHSSPDEVHMINPVLTLSHDNEKVTSNVNGKAFNNDLRSLNKKITELEMKLNWFNDRS